MSFTLVVDSAATQEAKVGRVWYEGEKRGLGDRFAKALQACYDRIEKNPYAFPLRKADFRHAMLHKFPYRVVFEVEGNTVFIYQVRHTSRKPHPKFGP